MACSAFSHLKESSVKNLTFVPSIGPRITLQKVFGMPQKISKTPVDNRDSTGVAVSRKSRVRTFHSLLFDFPSLPTQC